MYSMFSVLSQIETLYYRSCHGHGHLSLSSFIPTGLFVHGRGCDCDGGDSDSDSGHALSDPNSYPRHVIPSIHYRNHNHSRDQ